MQKRLQSFSSYIQKGFIILDPEPKNYAEARLIAQMVRKQAYITIAPNYIDCKDVCALIWIAGHIRVLEPEASVQIKKRTITEQDLRSLKIPNQERRVIQNVGNRELLLQGPDEQTSEIAFTVATMSELIEYEKGMILLNKVVEKAKKQDD